MGADERKLRAVAPAVIDSFFHGLQTLGLPAIEAMGRALDAVEAAQVEDLFSTGAADRVATFLQVLDQVNENHPDILLTTGAATALLKSDLFALVAQSRAPVLSKPEAEGSRSSECTYVPGLWRCAKCKLDLIASNLNAYSGSVTANNDPQQCPNACGPMWRVSEADYRKELLAWIGKPPFQERVAPFMLQCFGSGIAADTVERNHRFLEESLELVQALGCPVGDARMLVEYVYGRPVGDPHQECGGVMVTLAALSTAAGLSMDHAGDAELKRVWEKIDGIREKQKSKPRNSPVPVALGKFYRDGMPE